MAIRTTFRELLEAIDDVAADDDEAVAALAHLVNSGAVRLGGRLSGAIIDLADQAGRSVAA
jgi:hypothetical protein